MFKRTLAVLMALVLITLPAFLPINTASALPTIPNPHQYRYASIAMPESLDPGWAYDTASSELMMQVYEPLIAYDHESTAAFVPMLANSLPKFEKVTETLTNTTVVDMTKPVCSNWISGTTNYHLYGWGPLQDKDGSGDLTVGDVVWFENQANHEYSFHGVVKKILFGIFPFTITLEVERVRIYFEIRTGVKFHPWTSDIPGYAAHTADELTTEDVEYTFERNCVLDHEGGPMWMIMRPTLGIQTTREYDLTDHAQAALVGHMIDNAFAHNSTHFWFNLVQTFPQFLNIITQSWAYVMNKAWIIALQEMYISDPAKRWYGWGDPVGVTLAAGSDNGNVYVYDEAGNLLWSYNTGADVASVATSFDGAYIAVGSLENKLYLFTRDGTKLWEKTVPISSGWGGGWMGTESKSVAISAHGEYVVAGCTDNLYVYKKGGTLHWSHAGKETCVGISPCGNYIVSCNNDDGTIHLFSIANSAPVWTESIGAFWVVTSNPGYVAASSGNTVYLYDKAGTQIWSYSHSKWDGDYIRVDMPQDGLSVVAVNDDPANYPGCVLCYWNHLYDGTSGWSSADNTPVWTFDPLGAPGDTDFYSVAISGNGDYITTGPSFGSYVFSSSSNVPLQTFSMGTGQSYDLTFDGQFGACGNRQGELYLFSKASSTPLWSKTIGGIVHTVALAYSPLPDYANWLGYTNPPYPDEIDAGPGHMCGTGPYYFDYLIQNDRWQIKKFDGYWGGWSPTMGRSEDLYLDTVIELYYEDPTLAFPLFLTDDPDTQCDSVYVPRQYMPDLIGQPCVRTWNEMHMLTLCCFVMSYDPEETSIYLPQMPIGTYKHDFFWDIQIRRAFAHLVNHTAFVQAAFLGEATWPNSIIKEGLKYHNPDQETYSYDLNEALRLFKLAWGGQAYSQGFKVTLIYPTGNIKKRDYCEWLEYALEVELKALDPSTNFQAEVIGLDWGTVYLPAMRLYQLASWVINWGANYPDPDALAKPFIHTRGAIAQFQRIQYGQSGMKQKHWDLTPWCLGTFGDPALTIDNDYVATVIEKAVLIDDSTAAGYNKREEMYFYIQDIYHQEVPSYGIYQPAGRRWERHWVQGWYFNQMSPYGDGPGGYFYHMWKGWCCPGDLDFRKDPVNGHLHLNYLTCDYLDLFKFRGYYLMPYYIPCSRMRYADYNCDKTIDYIDLFRFREYYIHYCQWSLCEGPCHWPWPPPPY